ncbi:uncharacterized protein METZ01_LOCUS412400, partial [marine metagenome]
VVRHVIEQHQLVVLQRLPAGTAQATADGEPGTDQAGDPPGEHDVSAQAGPDGAVCTVETLFERTHGGFINEVSRWQGQKPAIWAPVTVNR